MPPTCEPALNEQTTESLVILAQQGHVKALEALVVRYQRLVYITLQQLAPERQDIADLSQEVLLRMCRSIKTLRNPKTFRYWLNRIITNLFYDALRKMPRQLRTVSLDEPIGWDDAEGTKPSRDVPDDSHPPEAMVLESELGQHIQAAIAELPEPFRLMIVLRELHGMSYEEIASLTQCQLGTVKSRLARARLKLQETLAPYLKGK